MRDVTDEELDGLLELCKERTPANFKCDNFHCGFQDDLVFQAVEKLPQLTAEIKRRRTDSRVRPLDERESFTVHFTVTNEERVIDGYLQPGHYADGRLCEIFVKIANDPALNSAMESWALLFSLLLQYGVPVEEMCKKFVGWHGIPAGRVHPPELVLDGTQNMPMCVSVQDLVCRFLRKRYGKKVATEPVVLRPDSPKASVTVEVAAEKVEIKIVPKHILKIQDGFGGAEGLCGATDGEFVEAALQSDCNKCRAYAGIGPMDEKGCGVVKVPAYEQQPEMLDKSGKPYARESINTDDVDWGPDPLVGETDEPEATDEGGENGESA